VLRNGYRSFLVEAWASKEDFSVKARDAGGARGVVKEGRGTGEVDVVPRTFISGVLEGMNVTMAGRD
jgi:hypothetical protein